MEGQPEQTQQEAAPAPAPVKYDVSDVKIEKQKKKLSEAQLKNLANMSLRKKEIKEQRLAAAAAEKSKEAKVGI